MDNRQSEIFRMPASAYATAYARRHAGIWITVLAIPVMAAVIAGFFDIRWWIIGLMTLMIVYPMVITMAWLTMTGRPDMALRLRPQKWTFGEDGNIAIDFYRFDYDSENPQPVATERADIASVSRGSRYADIRLKPGSRFDLLLIPAGMLPDSILNNYSE